MGRGRDCEAGRCRGGTVCRDGGVTRDGRLVAQSELLDHRPVSVKIGPAKIVQQPPPTTDHLQETPSTVVVARVTPKMLVELLDAGGQQRDLHRRRSLVVLVSRELLYDFLLGSLVQFLDPSSLGLRIGVRCRRADACIRFLYKTQSIDAAPLSVKRGGTGTRPFESRISPGRMRSSATHFFERARLPGVA